MGGGSRLIYCDARHKPVSDLGHVCALADTRAGWKGMGCAEGCWGVLIEKCVRRCSVACAALPAMRLSKDRARAHVWNYNRISVKYVLSI